MKLKNMLVTLAFLISVVLLAGCGKKKWNYIDGVAYSTPTNYEYASVVLSDPTFETPVIVKEFEGRTVERIETDAFSGSVLTSIVIPDHNSY